MGNTDKYYYYVGIKTNGGMTLVTEVIKDNKTCFWNENEKPLAMTEKQAEDLVFGLNLNMTFAVVVKSKFELEGHFLANND